MRFAFLLTGLLVLAVALPGIGVAAAPIVNDHTRFTDNFPDELCGISGTSMITVVDNLKIFDKGTFLHTSRFTQVFTADETGKQVRISAAGQDSGPFDPIDNRDGTITFVTTFVHWPA